MHTEEEGGYCELPSLEILVHTPEGEYHSTLYTDEHGYLKISDIPSLHLATVAPLFSSQAGNRIISEQKEALVNYAAYGNDYLLHYFESYPGDTGSCFDYHQLVVNVENPDNLRTDPPIKNGSIQLGPDTPGIVVFEDSDHSNFISASGFIYREQLSPNEVLVLSDIPLEPTEMFDISIESDQTRVNQSPFTRDYQFSVQYSETLEPGTHQLTSFAEPLENHLLAAQSEQYEEQWVNYMRVLVSSKDNIEIPDLSSSELQLLNVSPEVINYQFSGFEPKSVWAGLSFSATNSKGEIGHYDQYVRVDTSNGVITFPKINPDLTNLKLDFVQLQVLETSNYSLNLGVRSTQPALSPRGHHVLTPPSKLNHDFNSVYLFKTLQ
ncbi:hypothetical protein [Aliagarivorans marinus]|uniref:hypothetical protein n=1 Tax=Aliagarivorans marinus TaxID=561965 RepID=UPI0012FB5C82|nr:hypothetical protein [Aliagarivorans marinus]